MKINVKYIVNGNCVICGKKLNKNKIFLCEECKEKIKKEDKNDNSTRSLS